jgi:hypothetical protein
MIFAAFLHRSTADRFLRRHAVQENGQRGPPTKVSTAVMQEPHSGASWRVRVGLGHGDW